MSPGPQEVAVVVFDLGGVLVELGSRGPFGSLQPPPDEAFWSRWLACPWVRRFERGECDPERFAAGVLETWGLDASPADLLHHFGRWPRGLLPGVADLVAELPSGIRRACFSNTNSLHWDGVFHAFGLPELFDEVFLSFRMGLVKPDAAAFAHLVAGLRRPPQRILFLDDNETNVAGARAVGLEAEHAVGVDGARAALARRGLVGAA